MKVTCQACDASFLAPDEKIRGRVVKYHCRKCNTLIIADGTKLSAPASAGAAEPTAPATPVTPAPPPSGRTDVWGDTTEVSAPPSVSEPEPPREPAKPLVTHDSTAGWEPVPVAQAAAFRATKAAPVAAPSDAAPTRRIGFAAAASPTIKVKEPQDQDERPTRKVTSEVSVELDWDLGAAPKESPAQAAPSAAPTPQQQAQQPAPQQPARQPGANETAKAPAGDAFSFPLFGNGASSGQQKPTAATPSSDLVQEVSIESFDPVGGLPSGLNDLRALSDKPATPAASKSGTTRVDFDELLSLSAPAAPSPALAPSPLDWGSSLGAPSPLWSEPAPAPPAPEVVQPTPVEEKKADTLPPARAAKPTVSEPEPRKPSSSNRGTLIAIAAGLIGITVGAIGVKAMSGGDAPSDRRLTTVEQAATGQPTMATTQSEPAQVAANETAKPEAPASAVTAIDPTAATPVAQGTSAASKSGKAQPTEPSTAKASADSGAKTATTAAATTTATTATTTPAVVTPPPAAAAAGAEFNKDAARTALSSAASSALGCGKSDGPKGVAKVSITFAPSGRVTTATVNGPPFSGTPTGGCIAATFRRATVPPFSGAPVSVSKTVQIQ